MTEMPLDDWGSDKLFFILTYLLYVCDVHALCVRVYRHTVCPWVWRPVANIGDLPPFRLYSIYIEAGSIALRFR